MLYNNQPVHHSRCGQTLVENFMLRIYNQPPPASFKDKRPKFGTDPRMFFEMNGDSYTFVDDVDNDFDFSIVWVDKNCKKLILQIWHNQENQLDLITPWLEDDNVYIITNAYNPSLVNNSRIFHIDFLFNRTRAYYQQFPFSTGIRKWYFKNSECYMLPQQVDADKKSKIFVAPNGILTSHPLEPRPQIYKNRLIDFLKKYSNLGYLNDPMLWSNADINYQSGIEEVQNLTKPTKYIRHGYNPAHNAYYEDSYIHICVETIEYGDTIAITEKIYDPLIKGHFILPFSTSGTIQYLLGRGFKFPDFVDYSYDNIKDDNIRFQTYISEVSRLINVSLHQWAQWWESYKEVRLHNQRVFWDSNFDKINLRQAMNLDIK